MLICHVSEVTHAPIGYHEWFVGIVGSEMVFIDSRLGSYQRASVVPRLSSEISTPLEPAVSPLYRPLLSTALARILP